MLKFNNICPLNVKYKSFFLPNLKQLYCNLISPVVSNAYPEDRGDVNCDQIKPRETQQCGYHPVQIDEINEQCLYLANPNTGVDAVFNNNIFHINQNKRSVNQPSKIPTLQRRNISGPSDGDQTKSGHAVQMNHLANQSATPQCMTYVAQLVETFETKKPLTPHHRKPCNYHYSRPTTKKPLSIIQSSCVVKLKTQEKMPMAHYQKQVIPVKAFCDHNMDSKHGHSYNTQVDSNELYNTLLDHFYKFCDEAKKDFKKAKACLVKASEDKEITQNEMFSVNQKWESTLKRKSLDSQKKSEMCLREVADNTHVNEKSGDIRRPKSSDINYFRQKSGAKIYKPNSSVIVVKSNVRKGVQGSQCLNVPSQTEDMALTQFDFSPGQNIVNNEPFSIPSQTITTLANICSTYIESHSRDKDFKIILPDNCDVTLLRNVIRASQTCPFVAVLKTKKKNYFRECHNYYEIKLKARTE